MATTTTGWSPRQAGYQPDTTIVTTTDAGGLHRHYVRTRHGTVARTWMGASVTEVTLRRPSHRCGTYQGSVHAVPGGWQAVDDSGPQPVPVGPVHADYLDAEARLLRRRTGQVARATYRWPY